MAQGGAGRGRRRSFIFMPGLKPEMFAKAAASGADLVCIDLEDAIHPADKEAARAQTMALMARLAPVPEVEVAVRVNALSTPEGLLDVAAVAAAGGQGPPALMLPKVDSAGEVALVSKLLDEAGLATALHVIVESAAGLEDCWRIARASPRLEALFFGAVDFSADIGAANAWEPLLYARSRVAAAAAGAGLDAIDVPWLDLADMAGMAAEARSARRLGFVGKGAIHPSQIPAINRTFTPSAEEVAHARRIVAAFREAATGLVVIDGKLIERPVLRAMERLLARAQASGEP